MRQLSLKKEKKKKRKKEKKGLYIHSTGSENKGEM